MAAPTHTAQHIIHSVTIYKCKKHFIKKQKYRNKLKMQEKTSDDGMSNKEQHEGKSKGWT